MLRNTIMTLAALLMAGTVDAQDKKVAGDGKGDPSRVICRTDKTTGSRVSNTKICMTAAEWAELKQLNRRDVERGQLNGYANRFGN